VQKLDLCFSIADGGYPSFVASSGSLSVAFRTSTGADASFTFSSVAAFSWREGEVPLAVDEPSVGACELTQSQFLLAHPSGATMNSSSLPRHLRLRFHPWGTLDVVCGSYAAAA
jgi:hypothetical protein